MSADNLLTALGFFLTLVGLLGSYFYVHLSTWFSEVASLESKWKLNEFGETPERIEARLECRYELARLHSHVPFLITLVISGFMGYLSWTACDLAKDLPSSLPVVDVHLRALTIFLLLFFALSLYFLIRGYTKTFGVARAIKKKLSAAD